MHSTYEDLISEIESRRKKSMDAFFNKYELDEYESDEEVVDFRSMEVISKKEGKVRKIVKIKSLRVYSKRKKKFTMGSFSSYSISSKAEELVEKIKCHMKAGGNIHEDENVNCCLEKDNFLEIPYENSDFSEENDSCVESLSLKKFTNETKVSTLSNVFSNKLKFPKNNRRNLDTISSYINPFLRMCDLSNNILNTDTSFETVKDKTAYISPSLHHFYKNISICSIADDHINYTNTVIQSNKDSSSKKIIPQELNVLIGSSNVVTPKRMKNYKAMCLKTTAWGCGVEDLVNDDSITDNYKSSDKKYSSKKENLIEKCASKDVICQFPKRYNFRSSKQCTPSTIHYSQDKYSKDSNDVFKSAKSKFNIPLHKHAFSNINHMNNEDHFTENRRKSLNKWIVPKELHSTFDDYNSNFETSKCLENFKLRYPEIELADCSIILKRNIFINKNNLNKPNCNNSKICPLSVPSSFPTNNANCRDFMLNHSTISPNYFNSETSFKIKTRSPIINCKKNDKFYLDLTPKRNAPLFPKGRVFTSFHSTSFNIKHKTVPALSEPVKELYNHVQNFDDIKDKSNVLRKRKCYTPTTPQLIPISRRKISKLKIPQDSILTL